MMTGGTIVRIDITGPAYRTIAGVGVGMAEARARARALIGAAAQVEPDPQRAGGHLLTLRARGAANGLLFETDGARVVRIRVGNWRVFPQ